MKVIVKGKGEITLGKADFILKGGEGSIYAVGDTAFKIYIDPQKVISPAKMRQLQLVQQDNIITPLRQVLDRKGRPIGYSMKYVPNSEPLCKLFTKSYRQRNGINTATVLQLIEQLREGVLCLHQQKILIVDLNELNFLVSDDYSQLYFVDVDSYQTVHFPATALMDSVRDRLAPPNVFSEGTDWFSFAVVSFQLLIGIHPYKGKHPTIKGLDSRMKASVSVLNSAVNIPPSCSPFAIVPDELLQWYTQVFEEGYRGPPPPISSTGRAVTITPSRRTFSSSLQVQLIEDCASSIIQHAYSAGSRLLVFAGAIQVDGKHYSPPAGHPIEALFTLKMNRPVVLYRQGKTHCLYHVLLEKEISITLNIQRFMVTDGRLYGLQNGKLLEIQLRDVGENIIVASRLVASCLRNGSTLFSGVLIQNMLGAMIVSRITAAGCQQRHIPELDGSRILDARSDGNVLSVIATIQGSYHLHLFRFDAKGEYDHRRIDGAGIDSLNTISLASGVCLLLHSSGELEVFAGKKNSSQRKIVDNTGLGTAMLTQEEGRVVVVRDQELLSICLQ